MRKLLLTLSLTSLLTVMVTGAAFASAHPGDRTETITATNCIECHENTDKHTTGPHGGYTTSTDKCSTCHDVHADAENAQLLMGQTLTEACNACHDLTATSAGPYNMTGEFTPEAAHRVVGIGMDPYTDTEGQDNGYLLDGIVTIPGGNATDGSAGILDTSTQGKLSGQVFTCNSCHTPHGVNTVDPYLGESQVKVQAVGLPDGVDFKLAVTSRLLKTKPNNVDAGVTQYGSAWCASCHAGRDNNIEVHHNHPVDEAAPAYKFLEQAWNNNWFSNKTGDVNNDVYNVVADGWVTVGPSGEVSQDPRTNKQYAMTATDFLTGLDRTTKDGYDAISNYAGKGPSCQQCHGSAREVEDVFNPNVNPERSNFPHISSNTGLLVEKQDDFCTNCHDPEILP